MIISASYKTDIPTFYGDWFLNRLRAGFCGMVNPYSRKPVRTSLLREDVDGFVFWSKNIAPFLPHLAEVNKLGFPFVIQHTINGYPRALEFSVVDADRSIDNVRRLAETYGPRVCVWRYDPIVFSSLTPAEFHLKNFDNLARRLEGAVDEVVISFAHFYQKTLRNMTWAGQTYRFDWRDPLIEEKRKLAESLVQIAQLRGMRLTVCSQRDYLVPGAGDALCIDVDRLSAVAGRPIVAKLQGNRPECGCFASRDIGEYDTCPHGCVYCYAVRNRELAQRQFKRHDPESEFLFAPRQERASLPVVGNGDGR